MIFILYRVPPLCGWDSTGALDYSVNWFARGNKETHLWGIKDVCKPLNLQKTLTGERPVAGLLYVRKCRQ